MEIHYDSEGKEPRYRTLPEAVYPSVGHLNFVNPDRLSKANYWRDVFPSVLKLLFEEKKRAALRKSQQAKEALDAKSTPSTSRAPKDGKRSLPLSPPPSLSPTHLCSASSSSNSENDENKCNATAKKAKRNVQIEMHDLSEAKQKQQQQQQKAVELNNNHQMLFQKKAKYEFQANHRWICINCSEHFVKFSRFIEHLRETDHVGQHYKLDE